MKNQVLRCFSGLCGLLFLGGVSAQSLEVIFLANEGFMLKGGSHVVIIDGLLERETFGQYAALPEAIYADLMAGNPPFEKVDLLLFSHEHEDHFQSTATYNYLLEHPDTLVVSSPQVITRLGAESENVLALWPDEGEVLERSAGDVQVEFMQFSHGSRQHADVQNLGQVIHLEGYTVLHLGDAAMEEFNFTTYDLGQRWFDVAIVPYWFFKSGPGQSIVRRQIKANHIIAAHVPPAELEDLKQMLARDWPEVILFESPLDSRTF